MKRSKYIWEIWSKQSPKSLYYYDLASMQLAKINYQNCGHSKVYVRRVLRDGIKMFKSRNYKD